MAVNARINTGSSIGRAIVTQQTRSTVVAQNFKPKPNIAVSDLIDTSVAGVENGQSLVFNSISNKFEANTITATVISVNGGAF
jgi:hypothetical protein